MIGIDTNVLVRFLVQDDADQADRATRAFARLTLDEPGFLTTVTLVEAFWVLTRAYRLDRVAVLETLEEVVNTDAMVVQDPDQVMAAFADARRGADFADALIHAACGARGCNAVLSFDERAQWQLGFVAPA